MIPLFPEFVNLDLRHKDVVDQFFRMMPPYSEFGFTNMFVWQTTMQVAVSTLHDNLVIKFGEPHNKSSYLTLIGTHNIDQTMTSLIEHVLATPLEDSIKIVPEHVIKHMSKAGDFEITEDYANHDYILSIPHLVALEGPEYEDKRHKVNQFHANYGHESRFVRLDMSDPLIVSQMRSVMEEWDAPVGHNSKDIVIEFTAIERALLNHHALPIEAYGVFHHDRLVAFSIIEKVHDKTVIGHFEKASKKYKGIFEYMNHHLGRRLQSDGFEFLNICQDLGLDGLRDAKKSYNPVRMHKKYTIAQKQPKSVHDKAQQNLRFVPV